jgi:hypothetical protein
MAEQHVGAALVASDPILLSERAIAELSAHHARSMHALVKEKPGRKPFRTINTMKDDPAGVERMSEEIKTRYAQLFKV